MSLPLHSANSGSTAGPSHIIAIAAGKGGVGKSTVTVNLARALAKLGRKVGILDADLYGPSLRRMLPEDSLPKQRGPTLVPADSQGIKLISMAYFRQENLSTSVRAPVANSLISQFLEQVEWGPLDYLLIDFPPGTGDIQLTLSQKAKLAAALMVTTPQQVSVMDVRKAMHLFMQVQVPVLGIVENMSYFANPQTGERLALFGEGGGRLLAEETGVPLLAQLPIDPLISLCGDEGCSLFRDRASASPAATAFMELADRFERELITLRTQMTIRKISQPDDTRIIIDWSDGMITNYRLSELQTRCPCAGCIADQQAVDPNVGCSQIANVGRYAIKIQYTSGCSNGIYAYDMLRQLAME